MNDASLLGAGRLRELCRQHGIRPRKSLGQNFVIDPNTIRKVVDLAKLRRSDVVIEIGAGAGSLTVALAGSVERVIAVEVDGRLIPLLDDLLAAHENVQVINSDAASLDWGSIDADALVANLPYNIAVSLVLLVLERAPRIRRLTVMTQREAGERLAASPGSKVYGASSVIAQFFAEVSVAARVSANAFWPVPNVDSVVVTLQRHESLPDVPVDRFARVVHAAFGQRRKMLRNALGELAGGTAQAEEVLRHAALDPRTRAEDVSLEGFVALAKAL